LCERELRADPPSGLAVAIKEWGGAVCIISHSTEFVTALCPEIWHVEAGELTHKGKVALVEDAFDDPSRPNSRTTSKAGTPRTGISRVGTPANGESAAGSAATSAANSGAEDVAEGLAKLALKPKKKKKVSPRGPVMLCAL
jgi:elongation factor 3